MKKPGGQGTLFFALFVLLGSSTFAQNAVVELRKPFSAKSLAGIVEFERGAGPVVGALVEEYTADWKSVIASTTTARDGRFALAKLADHKTHYLQVSIRGANTLRVKVKLSRKAADNLVLIMQLST